MNIAPSPNRPMQLTHFAVLILTALPISLSAGLALLDGNMEIPQDTTGSTPSVWLEDLLILILILTNLWISYAVFRRVSHALHGVRCALVWVLFTMAIVLIWTGFRLYRLSFCHSASLTEHTDASYNWIWLTAVFGACTSVMLYCCRSIRKKPCIKMSAASKMVCLKGEWISIEEYLSREMGIDVSHGMTGEELEEALRVYREDTATNGIPRPKDTP